MCLVVVILLVALILYLWYNKKVDNFTGFSIPCVHDRQCPSNQGCYIDVDAPMGFCGNYCLSKDDCTYPNICWKKLPNEVGKCGLPTGFSRSVA